MRDYSRPAGVTGLQDVACEARFSAHMLARERWFRELFGETDPPDSIMSPGDPKLSVNWPGGGVLRFPPHADRRHWVYATSGLAQPVHADEFEPTDHSGWGIELVMSTPEANLWAPTVLLNLVRYLLFQETARVILPGDRIPCGGPIVTDSAIRHLVAGRSPDYDPDGLLPAGACELVHLVGATDAEIQRALSLGSGTAGSLVLCEVFRRAGIGPVTDPTRPCVTTRPDFAQLWAGAMAVLSA